MLNRLKERPKLSSKVKVFDSNGNAFDANGNGKIWSVKTESDLSL